MRVGIVGVGDTPYRKVAPESVEELARRAVTEACEDAGIGVGDIDGLISYLPHHGGDDLVVSSGLRNAGVRIVVDTGGAAAVSALGRAADLIRGGSARYVLLVRALKGNSGLRKAKRPSFLPGAMLRREIEHKLGINIPAQRYAFIAQRYMAEFGITREHLGEIALAARSHANLNPKAQMYDRELSMDAYMAARPIVKPYHLFDCCLETDGACAVIVGPLSEARAGMGSRRVPEILAVEDAFPWPPDDISNRESLFSTGLEVAAGRLWTRTGLNPRDVDAAMVYDCFTFEAFHQLEAAGFGDATEIADLIASGGIRLGGRLPVNTHGGLLSEGHMAGLNHVIEATRQLRGEAGDRQVEGARRIVVTGWGNLGEGSITLMEGAEVQ